MRSPISLRSVSICVSPGRPGTRSRRAGVRDGSSCAPAGSADTSDAPARPATALPACAPARRRFRVSARCGRAPSRSTPFRDCAAARAERSIDDNHFRFERARFRGDFFDLALADQARGTRLGQRHDVLGENGKPIAEVSPAASASRASASRSVRAPRVSARHAEAWRSLSRRAIRRFAVWDSGGFQRRRLSVL